MLRAPAQAPLAAARRRAARRHQPGAAGSWCARWARVAARADSSSGDGATAPGGTTSPPPPDVCNESGTVWGSALLVAGTTIGAGILALPAVTEEAGFVPAAATLSAVCVFSIATGLLIAEVCLRLARERGAGSVSMISMARATLGPAGAAATAGAYMFLHYALLVAYMSKAGEIIGDATGLPLLASAGAFTCSFGLGCYLSSQSLLDRLNGALVGLVIACFVGLLVAAGPGVSADSLVQGGNWAAVPGTLPVVALAFVFHNVVPVVVTALEGDVAKVRSAIVGGVAIPWLMFVSWEGAILGSLDSLPAQTQAAASSGTAAASAPAGAAVAGATGSGLETAPSTGTVVAPSASASSSGGGGGSSGASSVRGDPLAALSASNAVVAPLISGFSFLAIATSFIGFILGLTDFLADGLRLPSRQAALPYLLTLLPPFAVAVTNPGIFLEALDTAGTYGVLTLFGVLPPAMAWRLRYGENSRQGARGSSDEAAASSDVVPFGRPALLAIGGAAAAVIVNELVQLVGHVPT